MYMKMKGIEPRGTPILRQFVREEDVQWTYQLYMNDIEIVQLEWFRSEPYQDYFRQGAQSSFRKLAQLVRAFQLPQVEINSCLITLIRIVQK